MWPEEIRRKKIEVIERTIDGFNTLADKWRKERLARGEDITKDISIGYNEMIVGIFRQWVESENELLVLENQFRKLVRPETRTVVRKKK